jgi:hypothetical protein
MLTALQQLLCRPNGLKRTMFRQAAKADDKIADVPARRLR